LEYEIVAGYFLDAWQQLLLQQYFTIIVAVNFHSRLHKKTIPYTRVSTMI